MTTRTSARWIEWVIGIITLLATGCAGGAASPAGSDAAVDDGSSAADAGADTATGDAGTASDAGADGLPEPGSGVCASLQRPTEPFAREAGHATLRGADLRCADLRGARLAGADLAGADLTGADLTGADLTGADLTGADLRAAALFGANLAGATLRGANLSLANLTGADLAGADLGGADLSSLRAVGLVACPATLPDRWRCASLLDGHGYALLGPGADLFYADLAGVDLEGADLEGADLEGATLTTARGSGVVTCPARLPDPWKCLTSSTSGRRFVIGPGADLEGTDLGGVSLVDAALDGVHAVGLIACPEDLPDGWRCLTRPATGRSVLLGPGANLSGADLAGMDLTGVDLSSTDLTGADLGGTLLVGARGLDLRGCPATLPPRFGCAPVANDRFALVGPGMDLSGAYLFGDLSHQDLTGANLEGADLRGADLSGTSLSGARLAGATAVDLLGCPSVLPGAGWICVPEHPQDPASAFVLVGPGIVLENVNLSGADLSAADLTGVRASFPVSGGGGSREADCPAALPPSWQCVGGYPHDDWTLLFIGPGADLSGIDLFNADLAGVDLHDANLTRVLFRSTDLRGADLTGADMTGAMFGAALTQWGDVVSSPRAWDLIGCPKKLPQAGFGCIPQQGSGRFALIGPGLTLPPDLTGMDLTGLDLSNTFGSVSPGCPAQPPSRWVCASVTGGFILAGPGAFLAQRDLSGVSLAGVDLTGAYMVGVKLRGAVLTSTNLTNADLPKADLTGANLRGAMLTGAELTGVIWSNTTCPDGTNSDAAGQTCIAHLVP